MTEERFAYTIVTRFLLLKNRRGEYISDVSNTRSASLMCVDELEKLSVISPFPFYTPEYFQKVKQIIETIKI